MAHNSMMVYSMLVVLSVLPSVTVGVAPTNYLKFSDQKGDVPEKAQNYAILNTRPAGILPLNMFTICDSIFIGYSRGLQTFYTIRMKDHTTLWYSLALYNEGLYGER